MEVSARQQSTRNWLGIAGLVVGILAFVSDMNGDALAGAALSFLLAFRAERIAVARAPAEAQ